MLLIYAYCLTYTFLLVSSSKNNTGKNKKVDLKDAESWRRRNDGPEAPLVNVEALNHHQQESVQRSNICPRLKLALVRKDLAVDKMKNARIALTEQETVNTDELDILDLYVKQLDMNEDIIYATVNWLDQSLTGKYKDISTMKLHLEQRFQSFRDAAFQEEHDYHKLLEAEKNINKSRESAGGNDSKQPGIVAKILSEISDAADDLEEGLADDILHNKENDEAAVPEGANIETVVKLESLAEDTVHRLVDAENNQFVLSRSQDSTVPHEDTALLVDLAYIIVVSTMFSSVCSIIHLPAMFGQIVCGIVLGPSAINILTSLVQIETIAQLGVFYIMYTVGLEFSPSHIKKVLFVSCVGSLGISIVMILGGALVSLAITRSSLTESTFISSCLSLSSTPLVVKLTSDHMTSGQEGTTSVMVDYVEVLLGVLVLQDVFMSLLLAFLPSISNTQATSVSLWPMLNVLLALVAVIVLSFLLVIILRKVNNQLLRLSNEMMTLMSSSLVFFMMWVTYKFGVSMELGCFLAGSIVSSVGNPLINKVESLIDPIKDLLSSLFFAAIGLHVFPSFVLVELGTLMVATILIVSYKFGAALIVMRISLGKTKRHNAVVVAAGLSQISEFSFVLSSRARHLGLISREVYLLILSVSTISLVLSPALWNLVMYIHTPSVIRLQRTLSNQSTA